MQGDIVAQGWELLLYGMGTVVLFLALLVLATTAMSGFVGRYLPEPETSSAEAAAAAIQRLREKAQPADDPNLVVAISAAIHRYRSDNNDQNN